MQAVSARSFAGQQVAARPAVQARVSDKPSCEGGQIPGSRQRPGLGAPAPRTQPHLTCDTAPHPGPAAGSGAAALGWRHPGGHARCRWGRGQPPGGSQAASGGAAAAAPDSRLAVPICDAGSLATTLRHYTESRCAEPSVVCPLLPAGPPQRDGARRLPRQHHQPDHGALHHAAPGCRPLRVS